MNLTLETKNAPEPDDDGEVKAALDDLTKAANEKAAENKAAVDAEIKALRGEIAALKRPGAQTDDEPSEEAKAFGSYLRQADRSPEIKTLTVSSDPQGGYLAPAEFGTEFLKDLIELSPLRALASIRSISSSSVTYTLLPWFFCPADNLAKRQERDQIPYLRWAEEGHLIPTPGNVVDFGFVEETIAEIAARYRVQEIAIDPAMSAGIVPRLQDMGLNVLHFRQGWLSMTPAIKETERALLAGKIRHGGHPVLRWNFANAVIDPGPTGDTARFSKAKSAEKIDGAVSAAMAISRAQASATGPSIFESDWIGNFSFA